MKARMTIVFGLLALAISVMAGIWLKGGIGIGIAGRNYPNEPLRVALVVPGSPADTAGIKTNWFLISVGGTNAVSMSAQECMKAVCGPVGTSVTLELADPATKHTNKFSVKRADIEMPAGIIPTNRPSGFLIAR
jgi:C-terminal processing protease CtpA/Prc